MHTCTTSSTVVYTWPQAAPTILKGADKQLRLSTSQLEVEGGESIYNQVLLSE